MTRDEFIEGNLPLVHKLANRFRGRGVEYEELYAAGCVGLVKAVDRFEPERGLCFSTYAVPLIIGVSACTLSRGSACCTSLKCR